MTWIRFEDVAFDHGKMHAVGDRIAMRHLRTMGWSGRMRMGGDVPAARLGELPVTRKMIDRLVEVGLWDEGMLYHEGPGWHIHDWEQFNPTPQEAKEREELAIQRRKDAAERQRRSRARRKAASEEGVTPDVTRDTTRDRVRDPLPDPTSPPGRVGSRDGPRDNPAAPGPARPGAGRAPGDEEDEDHPVGLDAIPDEAMESPMMRQLVERQRSRQLELGRDDRLRAVDDERGAA